MKVAFPLTAVAIAVVSVAALTVRSRNRLSDPVLEVGSFQFTRQDLDQRLRVLQFYFPQDKNLNPRNDLVRVYSTVQVLLDFGIPNLRDRVIAEDKRIDNSTLDPTGLARIKRIFNGDIEAYRRLFVLPVLAPRLFSDFASRHTIPQGKSRATAARFIEAALQKPAAFGAIAAKQKLVRRRLVVSEAKGVRWDEAKIQPGDTGTSGNNGDVHPMLLEKWKKDSHDKEQSEAEQWVRRHAVGLKVGQVSPEMIDHGEVWLAIKLLGTNRDNELLFDSASVPKDPTEQWQKEQEAKILSKDL